MKVVCLLSSGIDSPVAAYMMASRGAEILLLHMDNLGVRDTRILDAVHEIAKVLREATQFPAPLFVAPYWKMQDSIRERCGRSYQCVLCKRFMLRTARDFAMERGAEAIITGDSLGQVASQTLQNIVVEQRGLNFPVLRPLIGLDKLEIEAVAKRIGTFQHSIVQTPPCPYLPPKPRTAARQGDMDHEESRLEPDVVLDEILAEVAQITL